MGITLMFSVSVYEKALNFATHYPAMYKVPN